MEQHIMFLKDATVDKTDNYSIHYL
jgi:hypothetical protein